MVEFVTLLFGFTFGLRPVQLAVDGPVASVEIRLDGNALGILTGSPWYLGIDFGQRLEPRTLEAIAFDADGRELDRARQLVNYARSNYEAVLVLESPAPGQGRAGRVIWQAILNRKPRSIAVTFDDRKLEVAKDGRFTLPAYDPGETHFLAATVRFDGGELARADLSFGGAYGERVTSALTAVPLLVPAGLQLPALAAMGGWFASGGETPRVFGVPSDEAEVLVVRAPGAGEPLQLAAREIQQSGRSVPAVVGGKDVVRVVPTVPDRERTSAFAWTDVPESKLRSGLLDVFLKVKPKSASGRRPRAWDGVAAAGKVASDGNLRRAVVILLGPRQPDASQLDPGQALGYLQSVRVPHFLWAPSERDLPRLDGFDANLYVGAGALADLLADLERSLASQRMVWLEGQHLPNRLTLTEHAPAGVRLAE